MRAARIQGEPRVASRGPDRSRSREPAPPPGSVVAFMDAAAAMGFVGNEAVKPIAEEARARLLRVQLRLAG